MNVRTLIINGNLRSEFQAVLAKALDSCEQDFDLDVAVGLDEGLTKLRKNPPDLVLLDPPGCGETRDPVATVQRVREEDALVPIIVLCEQGDCPLLEDIQPDIDGLISKTTTDPSEVSSILITGLTKKPHIASPIQPIVTSRLRSFRESRRRLAEYKASLEEFAVAIRERNASQERFRIEYGKLCSKERVADV